MVEKHPHLDLPGVQNPSKKKSANPGFLKKLDRDYKQFQQTQLAKLDNIANQYIAQRNQFGGYDQELVLKIKTSQKVHDDQFRIDLRRAGLNTLLSTPGKNATWIVSTKDPTFVKLKEKMKKREDSRNSTFVDGIETFEELMTDDKLGELLKMKPLGRVESAKLVVSLTKREDDLEGHKLNLAMDRITQLVHDSGFDVNDKLITENLCMLLVTCNTNLMNQISKIDLVTNIDRTPEFQLEEVLDIQLEDVDGGLSPPADAHGILVMDSGVVKHPLLKSSLDDDGIVGLPDRIQLDDKHHGTMVSGNALFGNISLAVQNPPLIPQVKIYSAKVFYQSGHSALPDPNNKLPGTIIQECVDDILTKFPKCRVINISFGDPNKIMKNGMNQFPLAALVDDLSTKYQSKSIIFVISLGNILNGFHQNHQFPTYLCQSLDEIKVMDPATSVHAISVGALENMPGGDAPSDITRTGPGLNQMIKPELVEIGGGLTTPIAVLNPNYQTRLFTVHRGTSFSAPIIANYLARLMNEFPQYSRNLIIALLLSSAKLPANRPSVFPEIKRTMSDTDLLQILNVYGYGKPDFDDAKESNDNYVLLKYDGSILIDHVRYFTINLPAEFAVEKGLKEISVSLVFDPLTRITRSDYVGTTMEFHLFRSHLLEEIQEKYEELDLTTEDDDTEEGKIPVALSADEIKLKPGSRTRKKTTHQKATAVFSRYEIDVSKPLVLVVICQKRWKMAENTQQNFAVVVTLRHSKEIDLYNKVQALNQTQVQAESRPRVRV